MATFGGPPFNAWALCLVAALGGGATVSCTSRDESPRPRRPHDARVGSARPPAAARDSGTALGAASDADTSSHLDATSRDAASADAAPMPLVRPPQDAGIVWSEDCLADPSRVVFFGDSYISGPTQLVPQIEQRARDAGRLGRNRHYPDYAMGGSTLDTPPGMGEVPEQWGRAINYVRDIRLVVLDGGGVDALVTNCHDDRDVDSPECSAVRARVIAMARALLGAMKQSGVANVLWVWYPDAPIGAHAWLARVFEQMQIACEALADDHFSCRILDTRPTFAGHDEYFTDEIHPNPLGAAALADAVWTAMDALCPVDPSVNWLGTSYVRAVSFSTSCPAASAGTRRSRSCPGRRPGARCLAR